MKNKLTPENRERKKTKAAKKLSNPFGKIVSAIIKANPKPDRDAKNEPSRRCFLVSVIPSLFTNVSFFIKRVLLDKTTIMGTKIIVNHITTFERVSNPKPDLINAAEAIPKLIPNQNTKFQNLSFVSHLLLAVGAVFIAASGFVKSCITRSYNWFTPYTNIVPKIEMIAKQFIAIVGVIGLLLCNNSAYGWVNSNEAVSRHEIIELIKAQEVKHRIPSGLLLAVIKTESNLNPFALNINGKPLYFGCKDEAIKAINEAVSSGVLNIDIGISQINYKWHGERFVSIDSMLSIDTNLSYAAEHLSNLKLKHGDWHKALRHYHSAKPIHHKVYSRKVVACWLGI